MYLIFFKFDIMSLTTLNMMAVKEIFKLIESFCVPKEMWTPSFLFIIKH